MPAVRINYRGPASTAGNLAPDEVEKLVKLLRRECAVRFSVAEWPLELGDFSVYDEPISQYSVQSHTVIIRIALHHFPVRVATAQQYAEELRAMVTDLLNNPETVHWYGLRTVGVAIELMEIAWSAD